MAKTNDKPKGSGRNGNVPPVEHRWKPGESGNPEGRPSVGKSVEQWANLLDERKTPAVELRRILEDETEQPSKRTAAARLLRMNESPDMADYEPYLNGAVNLEQLKASGVDTSVIKKVKERRELNKEGETVAVTREIELHDRSGEEFDRVCDRTEGKPKQSVDLGGSLRIPTGVTMNVVGPWREGQAL
jgi:hypothetical protein